MSCNSDFSNTINLLDAVMSNQHSTKLLMEQARKIKLTDETSWPCCFKFITAIYQETEMNYRDFDVKEALYSRTEKAFSILKPLLRSSATVH